MGRFIILYVFVDVSGIIGVFVAFLETGNPCDGHETFRKRCFVWTTISGCDAGYTLEVVEHAIV